MDWSMNDRLYNRFRTQKIACSLILKDRPNSNCCTNHNNTSVTSPVRFRGWLPKTAVTFRRNFVPDRCLGLRVKRKRATRREGGRDQLESSTYCGSCMRCPRHEGDVITAQNEITLGHFRISVTICRFHSFSTGEKLHSSNHKEINTKLPSYPDCFHFKQLDVPVRCLSAVHLFSIGRQRPHRQPTLRNESVATCWVPQGLSSEPPDPVIVQNCLFARQNVCEKSIQPGYTDVAVNYIPCYRSHNRKLVIYLNVVNGYAINCEWWQYNINSRCSFPNLNADKNNLTPRKRQNLCLHARRFF